MQPHRPVRVRLKHNGDIITIYCTSTIAREISQHVMRITNNILVPP